MTEGEHGIVLRVMELSKLQWLYPEEAVHKLESLAALYCVDPHRSGRTLPDNNHRLEILGRIVRALHLHAPLDTPEQMRAAYDRLAARDKRFFQHLLHTALQATTDRQAAAPGTPLGFPPGKLALWSNLLDQGWILMPKNARFPANDVR